MAQSPFPGMDPYLELPELWPDVHNRLMNLFAEQLGDLLAPKYIAELDTQIVIDSFGDLPPEIESALPDVTITQPRMIRESSAESTTVAAPLRLRVPQSVPTRLVTIYIRYRENERLVTVRDSEILNHPDTIGGTISTNQRSSCGRRVTCASTAAIAAFVSLTPVV